MHSRRRWSMKWVKWSCLSYLFTSKSLLTSYICRLLWPEHVKWTVHQAEPWIGLVSTRPLICGTLSLMCRVNKRELFWCPWKLFSIKFGSVRVYYVSICASDPQELHQSDKDHWFQSSGSVSQSDPMRTLSVVHSCYLFVLHLDAL